MKTITSIITTCLLIGSSLVYAGQGPGAVSATAVAPAPQLMQQNMFGRPDIAADGINNATQVDDPTDIGDAAYAPDPLLVEGSAGVQDTK